MGSDSPNLFVAAARKASETFDRARVTPEVSKFASTNRSFWESYRSREGDGVVVVDATLEHPHYILSHSILANFIAEETDSSLLFVMSNRLGRKYRTVCKSFGDAEFVYYSDRKRHLRDRIRAYRDAGEIFEGINNGSELQNVRYEGILVGDLVYNTYSRTERVGTIDELDSSHFEYLYDTLLTKRFYDRVIESNDSEKIVLAHLFYAKTGLLGRVALDHDVEVMSRKLGPLEFASRRYRTLEDIKTETLRPTEDLFEYIWDEYRDEAVERGERELEKRMSGDSQKIGVSRAFTGDELSGNELTQQYDLSDKPTVIIMSHTLPEHGGPDWLLFKDYLVWLRRTVQRAVQNTDVNWLVKPHPRYETLECKHDAIGNVESIIDEFDNHTFSILDTGLNTESLLGVADAAVTARGSAGIEFPCFGIPCITAAKSKYSGFGFTHDPETKIEYFEYLDILPDVEPLSTEQVERAKVMAYIQFGLLPVQSEMIPEMKTDNMDLDEDDIWRRAAMKIEDTAPQEDPLYSDLMRYIRNDFTHLLNYGEIGLKDANNVPTTTELNAAEGND